MPTNFDDMLDNILAGPETDRLVWQTIYSGRQAHMTPLLPYSARGDFLAILEEAKRREWVWVISSGVECVVTFHALESPKLSVGGVAVIRGATADTVPLAVCRAWLKTCAAFEQAKIAQSSTTKGQANDRT